jgi:5-methyltetrahydropteroyltriglutamate--homocysteine methyltransferase
MHHGEESAMTAREKPPFRADHVGSLRRPETLRQARERLLGPHDLDHNFGPHDNAELHRLEDQAIREAVRLQEAAGLRSITDGEFRRRIWWSEFLLALEGVRGSYRGLERFRDQTGHEVPSPRIDVNAKVRWTGSPNVAPFAFLKSLTAQTPKVTMPAPQQLYFFASRDTISRQAYPELDALWRDLAGAYSAELHALSEAGCTYVQMDEVVTSCLCDEKQRARLHNRGDDPDEFLAAYIRTMNQIIADKPRGMTLVMHTCRGNYQGHWAAEGGYDPVAERVFSEIRVDAFFLEYDTPRAGSFEPLRFYPKDKTLVLGLVSTKTPQLESQDVLKKRIEEAARYVPLENLCLSPQCGFSSNYLGNPVTIDDERRKLELVVNTAQAVWGSV